MEIYFAKYIFLGFAFLNFVVNADQQHNLQRQHTTTHNNTQQ
jgi:hypothetical protein